MVRPSPSHSVMNQKINENFEFQKNGPYWTLFLFWFNTPRYLIVRMGHFCYPLGTRVVFSQSAFWMFWKQTFFFLADILNLLKSSFCRTFMKIKLILESKPIVFLGLYYFYFNKCLANWAFQKVQYGCLEKTVCFQIV